jgi:maltooligosyltrehalose trehalohydrolase
VALAVVLFSLGTPLLFMGEEHDETAPFQFFTDHIDPVIVEATRSGRKREFQSFSAFAGADIPDPQAEKTVLRSKLDRSHADPEVRAFYAELLRLRRELPPTMDTTVDTAKRTLTLQRGDVVLHADFAARTVELRR